MCGIAGAVGRSVVDPDVLNSQLKLLEHRGPDSHGVFSVGDGQVGQTRLRIIDLVTGDPPIASEDGQAGVSLNGEIYNYRALQDELRARGHRLKTETDTEVIVHLAEECEPLELANRLEGMFAFAVWDAHRRRLILGRDRLGKKPLYYWSGGGGIVFGSEIKAVLAHPAVPRRLEESAIASYLSFGYVPTPRTFFEGVFSLPPGHVLVFEPGGRAIVERYWQLPLKGMASTNGSAPTLTEAAADCRRLLEQAVRRRMVSDVPLGAYLSGGIDSSSVVALMASAVKGPVRSFAIGFEDFDGFDERPYANLVAQLFKAEHTEFVVKPDAIDLVEKLVWHHDQPFGDSSAIPSYVSAQLTKEHVTVALCGDGGDELFAGYERFGGALAVSRYQLLPAPLRRLGEKAVDLLPAGLAGGRVGSIQRFADRADLEPHEALRSWSATSRRSGAAGCSAPAPTWASTRTSRSGSSLPKHRC
jgi:asparagine synthase (glutamine-hydrolysing)